MGRRVLMGTDPGTWGPPGSEFLGSTEGSSAKTSSSLFYSAVQGFVQACLFQGKVNRKKCMKSTGYQSHTMRLHGLTEIPTDKQRLPFHSELCHKPLTDLTVGAQWPSQTQRESKVRPARHRRMVSLCVAYWKRAHLGDQGSGLPRATWLCRLSRHPASPVCVWVLSGTRCGPPTPLVISEGARTALSTYHYWAHSGCQEWLPLWYGSSTGGKAKGILLSAQYMSEFFELPHRNIHFLYK